MTEGLIPLAEWFVKTYGIPGALILWLIVRDYYREKRLNSLTDQLVGKAETYAQSSIDRETSMQSTLERILMMLENLRGSK